MKILVTGATGYLGSHIIDALLQYKVDIIATSRRASVAMEKPWYPKVKYYEFDLNEMDSTINYQSYFENPDAVIHLAWSGLPFYTSPFHLEENLPLNIAFLNNLIFYGQKDLTIIGTCLEYGMQEGELLEDMDSKPIIAYALAKDELRKYLQAMHVNNSFMLKWVRLFYSFGEGQNSNSIIPQLNIALSSNQEVFNMSGGEQIRDYLEVETVAQYIVKIAMQNRITGIINCSSGKGVKVIEFINEYLRKKNKKITLNLGHFPYLEYEPMQFWGNNYKLLEILKNYKIYER